MVRLCPLYMGSFPSSSSSSSSDYHHGPLRDHANSLASSNGGDILVTWQSLSDGAAHARGHNTSIRQQYEWKLKPHFVKKKKKKLKKRRKKEMLLLSILSNKSRHKTASASTLANLPRARPYYARHSSSPSLFVRCRVACQPPHVRLNKSRSRC